MATVWAVALLVSVVPAGTTVEWLLVLEVVFLVPAVAAATTVASLVAAAAVAAARLTAAPNYHVRVDTAWMGVVVALAIGFVGGIIPAWRLRRLRTVDVLREGA